MTIKNQENWEKLDLMMIVMTKGRLKIIGALLMTVGTPSQTLHVYPALHSSEELRVWNQTSLSSRPASILY